VEETTGRMSDGGEARPTYHRVLLKLSGEAFAHD
jgi:hypothetical protein